MLATWIRISTNDNYLPHRGMTVEGFWPTPDHQLENSCHYNSELFHIGTHLYESLLSINGVIHVMFKGKWLMDKSLDWTLKLSAICQRESDAHMPSCIDGPLSVLPFVIWRDDDQHSWLYGYTLQECLVVTEELGCVIKHQGQRCTVPSYVPPHNHTLSARWPCWPFKKSFKILPLLKVLTTSKHHSSPKQSMPTNPPDLLIRENNSPDCISRLPHSGWNMHIH